MRFKAILCLPDAQEGLSSLLHLTIYRIAGNFDVFDAFQPDHQNLTRQIFKAIQHLVKDCNDLLNQIFEKLVSVKFSPIKISCCTVYFNYSIRAVKFVDIRIVRKLDHYIPLYNSVFIIHTSCGTHKR